MPPATSIDENTQFYTNNDSNMTMFSMTPPNQLQYAPVSQEAQVSNANISRQMQFQHSIQNTQPQCPSRPGQQEQWEFPPQIQYAPFDQVQQAIQFENDFSKELWQQQAMDPAFATLLRECGFPTSNSLPIERSQSDMGPQTHVPNFAPFQQSSEKQSSRPTSSRSMYDFRNQPNGSHRPVTPIQESPGSLNDATVTMNTFTPIKRTSTPINSTVFSHFRNGSVQHTDSSNFDLAQAYSATPSQYSHPSNRSSVDFGVLESPSKTLGPFMANLNFSSETSPVMEPLVYDAESPASSSDFDDSGSPAPVGNWVIRETSGIRYRHINTGVHIDDITVYIEEDHSNPKMPYVCTYDGCKKSVKRFDRRENAKAHIQTHVGDKPCGCLHCDAAFSRFHDLKRHINKHNDDRMYKCPAYPDRCNFNGDRKDALNRHLQRCICPGGVEKYPHLHALKKDSPTKRGRPKKKRPDVETRQEKATRQRKKNATKGGDNISDSISVSMSESSFPASDTSPVMQTMSINMADLLMPQSPNSSNSVKNEDCINNTTSFRLTPPLSPDVASCGNVSPKKDEPLSQPADTPPGSPPELIHSPQPSLEEELPSTAFTDGDGMNDELFGELLQAEMIKEEDSLFVAM